MKPTSTFASSLYFCSLINLLRGIPLSIVIPVSVIVNTVYPEIFAVCICDLPRENRPSSHLVMIVEIPVLKFLIGITSFCSC